MTKTAVPLWQAFLLAGFFLLLPAQLPWGQASTGPNLPPGEGRDLFASVCSQCHGLGTTLILRNGRLGWKKLVQDMAMRGAQLSEEDAETIIRYLERNFGPGDSPRPGSAPGSAPAVARSGGKGNVTSLPDGPGKGLVESRCSSCHDLERVVSLGRSKDEWKNITDDMAERGPSLTPEQIQTIVEYLTDKFGKESK